MLPNFENTIKEEDNEEGEKNNYKIKEYLSFDDMSLPENLLRGIYSYGFTNPSIIQSKAIVPLREGKDIIAQSQSGTGKTGAFSIGCLSKIDLTVNKPQAIIISPTRELAEQTKNVICDLNLKLKASVSLSVGGTSVGKNIRNLEEGKQIIIGTPGRIYDLILRRALSTRTVNLFILDEADEMLSHGFKDQIYDIFTKLPKTVQVGLFSATLPDEVLELTKKFMKDPVEILINKEDLTLDGIKQFYIDLDQEEWKLDTLIDLYKTVTLAQTIIYVNSKGKCESLTYKLSEKGYPVAAMHSNMHPTERTQIMSDFRLGKSRILISTDLLARGIDVQQVSLVVNYDLPTNIENYIHRIGRSGRFGRKGVAINFITRDDANRLKMLQEYYSTKIDLLPTNIADLL